MMHVSYRLLWIASIFLINQAFAQGPVPGRPSPALSWDTTFNAVTIKIQYGAPSVKGREIWGKLVPYGEVWRTGANEATTFESNQAILVEGKPLPAGKYAIFTIPGKKTWTVIFHNNPAQWGAYGYKSSGDVLRVEVQPEETSELTEQLQFTSTITGFCLKWENLLVPVSIKEKL